MADSQLFKFFNEHPVFPVILLASNASALLPIIILIYISQIAPLHGNCRFILCLWAIGLGAVIAADSGCAILDLQNDTGYMAMSMVQPHMRVQLYKFDVTCATFSSSFEIMACAYFIDEALYSEDQDIRFFANVALGMIELSVLVAGFIASKVCGIRYKSIYAISSLAERYQAKEAYEMSKAMIPAYIISFIIKATTVTAILLFLNFIREGYLTGYVQMYIAMTHVCYIIFSTTTLLLIHPILRKHTYRKLESLMNLNAKRAARIASINTDTETYFSMLSASWNK